MSAAKLAVRTSERLLFRRCRRLWGWTSIRKMDLEVKARPDYFWFGTGMHWALEDCHGYNKYGHPAQAFWAYYQACKEAHTLPPTADELILVGIGMMQYYWDIWLKEQDRQPLPTLWVNGTPMCELRFEIPLPMEDGEGNQLSYRGTIDRVIEDEHGRLWVGEYKSAKAFRLYHFDTDDQITAYCCALQAIFPDREVAGVCYQQHRKMFPTPPKILKSGRVSTAANMSTSRGLYNKVLRDVYGTWDNYPADNKAYLHKLASEEDIDGDAFIRRDWIYRNNHQMAAQWEKIMMELEDMTRPNLPLYPNPGKDCAWQCPLESVCVAMDDGSDWESLLESLTIQRLPNSQEEQDKWRNHLQPLENLPLLPQLPEDLNLLEHSQLPSPQEQGEEGRVMLLEMLGLQW